jgi:ketosteroid isomerase-like protein
MSPRIASVAALLTLLVAQSVSAATREELTAQVRAAETAFADSMAKRDMKAFAAHVADEAVFFGRRGELRGKAAVIDEWKQYFTGPAPFSWKPESVAVLDSGKLAWSSGPVFDPQGKRVGTFNSTWRLEADGRWRVIFDNGCPACACAQP